LPGERLGNLVPRFVESPVMPVDYRHVAQGCSQAVGEVG
jgi:hypothetical protein